MSSKIQCDICSQLAPCSQSPKFLHVFISDCSSGSLERREIDICPSCRKTLTEFREFINHDIIVETGDLYKTKKADTFLNWVLKGE